MGLTLKPSNDLQTGPPGMQGPNGGNGLEGETGLTGMQGADGDRATLSEFCHIDILPALIVHTGAGSKSSCASFCDLGSRSDSPPLFLPFLSSTQPAQRWLAGSASRGRTARPPTMQPMVCAELMGGL